MQEFEKCHRKDCIYRGYIASRKDDYSYCNYACIEHQPRRCSIADCDKYKPLKRKRKAVMRDGYIQWVEIEKNGSTKKTDGNADK